MRAGTLIIDCKLSFKSKETMWAKGIKRVAH
jgi:hypothetical protein